MQPRIRNETLITFGLALSDEIISWRIARHRIGCDRLASAAPSSFRDSELSRPVLGRSVRSFLLDEGGSCRTRLTNIDSNRPFSRTFRSFLSETRRLQGSNPADMCQGNTDPCCQEIMNAATTFMAGECASFPDQLSSLAAQTQAVYSEFCTNPCYGQITVSIRKVASSFPHWRSGGDHRCRSFFPLWLLLVCRML